MGLYVYTVRVTMHKLTQDITVCGGARKNYFCALKVIDLSPLMKMFVQM